MTASTLHLADISLSLIDLPADHRRVDPDAAQALSESVARIGLRQPIEVVRSDARYRLIFGATRLAAFTLLSRDIIPAFVREASEFRDDAPMRLVSIAENLYRRELTVLDRSLDIAAWCSIYRAAQPSKPGPKPSARAAEPAHSVFSVNLTPNSDEALIEGAQVFAATFSEAAQSALGVSRKGVFRALKIASIAADVRDRIALSDMANHQQELLALAGESYERQSRIVDLILSGEVATVAEAVALIDNRPAESLKLAWEKIADRFSRLKTSEQDAFFRLHESAVLRWVAETGRR